MSSPADWAQLSQRSELSAEDVAEIAKRLDRFDVPAPWTSEVLGLIDTYPGVVSTELAARIGMERFAFKKLVYKLKRLGLTHSLEVGYRDVRTTMIHTHVLNRGGLGVMSPLDGAASYVEREGLTRAKPAPAHELKRQVAKGADHDPCQNGREG